VAPEDKAEELTALVQEIRDRVRARYPDSNARPGLILPDLMPLVHARDAAEAKVAAIGTVNPRRGGPFNALAQTIKKLVARALDWHVREQVEFNRQVLACVESTLEALHETRRALMRMDVTRPKSATCVRTGPSGAPSGSTSYSSTRLSFCAAWPICRAPFSIAPL